MKITFLTENIHCGGLDSFLISLVNHWPYPEDELRIICNPAHPGYQVLKDRIIRPCEVVRHDISTYPVLVSKSNRNRFLRTARRVLSPLLRYGYFVYYLIRLRSIFAKWQTDRLMVVNGGHPGGDTCRAAVIAWRLFHEDKPRAIYNFHNLANMPNRIDRLPEKLMDSWLVSNARALVGVSKICAESLRKRIGDTAMNKVSYIYNGIAEPVESANLGTSLREELGIPAGVPLCLMLATYEPRKGHDFLFRAFQKVIAAIPNAHLVVCGYGYPEEVERVRHLIELYDLSRHVNLQGFRSDVDAMLKQADVLLVASQIFESFGLTSVEAMANRVPVVATRVGGVPEVVADGEGGFCVGPDDVQGYANHIIAFLKESDFRKEQAKKGYQRYRRLFSAERMAKEYAMLVHREC
ncbi:glycosyltransferase family 4 protein [Candidatus Ferrigenium straubiae]|uniref:glycosyltransferase family 4 protein n=1 Tax=Candidatus Ferrigenium straubiae TaxID=2919506 RepID=UPI003F4ABCAC